MDRGRPLSPPAEDHIRGCGACRDFERGAWRIRELVRFEVAPPVPDLVPAIMAGVEAEAAPRRRQGDRRIPASVTVAAAFVGLVAGYVLTVGGVIPDRP